MSDTSILRAIRRRTGKSQADVALAIGVDATTIGRYETGARSPTISALARLLDVLEATDAERLAVLEAARSVEPGEAA